MDFAIGGILVMALVIGITEAAKDFGIQGNGSKVVALITGIFFVGLAEAINQGLVPAAWLPWIEVAVTGLAGGLAAMGYYDLGKRFLGKNGQ